MTQFTFTDSIPYLSGQYRHVLLYGEDRAALTKCLGQWQRQHRVDPALIKLHFALQADHLVSLVNEENSQHFDLIICQPSHSDNFSSLVNLTTRLASEALFLRTRTPLIVKNPLSEKTSVLFE